MNLDHGHKKRASGWPGRWTWLPTRGNGQRVLKRWWVVLLFMDDPQELAPRMTLEDIHRPGYPHASFRMLWSRIALAILLVNRKWFSNVKSVLTTVGSSVVTTSAGMGATLPLLNTGGLSCIPNILRTELLKSLYTSAGALSPFNCKKLVSITNNSFCL